MTLPVADRLELSDLVHRYAAYVDARRFDNIAELFTATAELVLPKPPEQLAPAIHHNGAAGIIAAMGALAGITRTHHSIVGEVYTAGAGDTATGEITGVAHHWTASGERITDLVWYLRYADEYHRTGPVWRIARRALTIDAIESRTARQVRS